MVEQELLLPTGRIENNIALVVVPPSGRTTNATKGEQLMKYLSVRLVLIGLVAVILAACNSQPQQQRPEQSVLVTAANETAALTRLRAIAGGEAQYQVESGGVYGTHDQLIAKRYVNDPTHG